LRLREPAQPLDAALARFGRLVPQVLLDGVTHRSADVRFEAMQVLGRFRGQQDVVAHSGYILARLACAASGQLLRRLAPARVSGGAHVAAQNPPNLVSRPLITSGPSRPGRVGYPAGRAPSQSRAPCTMSESRQMTHADPAPPSAWPAVRTALLAAVIAVLLLGAGWLGPLFAAAAAAVAVFLLALT